MTCIYFVEDTGAVELPPVERTLCLHHKDYPSPQIPGADVLQFAAFQARYKNEPELLDYERIVFVGTNRIITPSNRTEAVFEVLFSGTRHIDKVSVDHTPFINSDPWRFWFHFGITNTEYAHYDYSYAAQTDYDKWLDDVSDYNPFSLEEMVKWSRGVVHVNYDAYFDWEIVEVPVMPNVRAEYEDLKAELFETENGPRPIVRKLSKFADSWCPNRYIPKPYIAFRKPRGLRIVKTDLPVDDYLTGEVVKLMQLTNDYLWSMHQLPPAKAGGLSKNSAAIGE